MERVVEKQELGHIFTFPFLIEKVPPQLNFVLIMKSGIVSIMFNGSSCHYQQAVLRYKPQILKLQSTPHLFFSISILLAVVVNCQQCNVKPPFSSSMWLVSLHKSGLCSVAQLKLSEVQESSNPLHPASTCSKPVVICSKWLFSVWPLFTL